MHSGDIQRSHSLDEDMSTSWLWPGSIPEDSDHIEWQASQSGSDALNRLMSEAKQPVRSASWTTSTSTTASWTSNRASSSVIPSMPTSTFSTLPSTSTVPSSNNSTRPARRPLSRRSSSMLLSTSTSSTPSSTTPLTRSRSHSNQDPQCSSNTEEKRGDPTLLLSLIKDVSRKVDENSDFKRRRMERQAKKEREVMRARRDRTKYYPKASPAGSAGKGKERMVENTTVIAPFLNGWNIESPTILDRISNAMDIDADPSSLTNSKVQECKQVVSDPVFTHQINPIQFNHPPIGTSLPLSSLSAIAAPPSSQPIPATIGFSQSSRLATSKPPSSGRQIQNREMPPPPTPPLPQSAASGTAMTTNQNGYSGHQRSMAAINSFSDYAVDHSDPAPINRKRPPSSPPKASSSPSKVHLPHRPLSVTITKLGAALRSSQHLLPPPLQSSQSGQTFTLSKPRLPVLGMRRTTAALTGGSNGSLNRATTTSNLSSVSSAIADRPIGSQNQRPRQFKPPFPKGALTPVVSALAAQTTMAVTMTAPASSFQRPSFEMASTGTKVPSVTSLPTPEATPTQSQSSAATITAPPSRHALHHPAHHPRPPPSIPASQRNSAANFVQLQHEVEKMDVVVNNANDGHRDQKQEEARSSSPADADASFNSSDFDMGIDPDELEKACSMYD